MCRSRTQLAAENLFLRKQLAYYVERQVRPRRADNAARITLVLLSRLVEWPDLLTIVRPDTLVRWHGELFRLFWRAKSRRRGRPRIPHDLQRLIAEMAAANRTWGEERIAAELRLKLGLTVSPRTVRRYLPPRSRPRGGRSIQSWATFLHNHASAVLACDFFVVVTATFQQLYVFVVPRHRHAAGHPLESHRPPDGGMDHPAVSEWPSTGCCISVSRPRSRRDLRSSRRRGTRFDVAPGAAHAAAGAAGQRLLRTLHRDRPARVPRLDDSAQRTTSPSRHGRVDSPLQRRTTTFRPGPRAARRPNAPRNPHRPPRAVCVPCRGQCETRWLTPRLPLGTRGRVNFLAEYRDFYNLCERNIALTRHERARVQRLP